MANEIQFRGAGTGVQHYALIRNRVGQVWSTSGGTGAFETYAAANFADYDIACTEEGVASNFYKGTIPAAMPAGIYGIDGRRQLGGAPAETDPSVATGDIQWNGTAIYPLSDLPVSGSVRPVRLERGAMVRNFPVYFKSSADHVTPFTSGVVSGQVARDGGSFGALQSGAFTERGLGWYTVQALTSGDLDAETVRLHFTAVGVSGGAADPVPLAVVTQRVSGY